MSDFQSTDWSPTNSGQAKRSDYKTTNGGYDFNDIGTVRALLMHTRLERDKHWERIAALEAALADVDHELNDHDGLDRMMASEGRQPSMRVQRIAKIQQTLAMAQATSRRRGDQRDTLKAEVERLRWIPCTEKMPDSQQRVLFAWANSLGKARTSTGNWIAPRTVEADDISTEVGECDYDDETDTAWAKPGWNEWGWETEYSAYVDEAVTHWMPIPKAPDLAEGGA